MENRRDQTRTSSLCAAQTREPFPNRRPPTLPPAAATPQSKKTPAPPSPKTDAKAPYPRPLRYTRKPGACGKPLPGQRNPSFPFVGTQPPAREAEAPPKGQPLPPQRPSGSPSGNLFSSLSDSAREDRSSPERDRILLMLMICLLAREKADRELIFSLIYVLMG